MTVPQGFAVEIVAAEPDLVNPVAMTFDERGRIWVTESLEYPRLEAGAGRDRIRVLEDTDHDGRADRFTTFAEGLNIPSGIAVGYGGVWVANAPDLLFLADDDGDLQADRREVVVTGFGREDTHELPNSLTWGPDGYLYGLNGVFNRSRVEQEGQVSEFTCAMFRIDPRTRRFEIFCEGTSNPWGIAWDSEGSAFVSACVIDHLWHLVESGYYHRQAGAYPPHTWKIESIVDHAHQKAAYCGIHYFDSAAYPEPYRRRLYMGNIHGNAINADRLTRHGATYRGETEEDLLRANDAWFMPVAQKTGPDGCLYILDWYDRYHCYQDARRDSDGIDRLKGRLYRLRYGETPRAGDFDLTQASDEQLIARLHDENVYFREVAQRLLAERASSAARPKLQTLVFDEAAPRHARLHALWALLGSRQLDPVFHEQLLSHADASLRAWGVRAAGNARSPDAALHAALGRLAGDPSPDVRLQVAIASRKLPQFEAIPTLLEVFSHSIDDPLLPRVVWQNLHPLLEAREQVARLVELTQGDQSAATAGLGLLTERLIERLIARRDRDVTPVTTLVLASTERRKADPAAARAALATLTSLVEAARLPAEQQASLHAAIEPRLVEIIAQGESAPLFLEALILSTSWQGGGAAKAVELFTTATTPTPVRVRALEALVLAPNQELWQYVTTLLAAGSDSVPIELRLATLRALAKFHAAPVPEFVLDLYPHLEPELRPAAIELLVSRQSWGRALLEAIAAKRVPAEALNVGQVRQLLASKDDDIAQRVRETWGTLRSERNPEREQVIRRVRALLEREPGNAEAGVAVFTRVCAECHRLHGAGKDVGPDLTLNGRNSFDQLLSNVLDPSLVVGAAYQARTVVTTDGKIFRGLVAEDSPERVVLKVQGGQLETVPRAEIDEMETSPLSLMPEGLERQLTERELLDLFAFLVLDRPPSDPTAKRLPGAP
ncbi:MAG: c-type cytochrome [Pirellulales bacterium]|nr:c-type cytochrome [Pirellulales bacterium]